MDMFRLGLEATKTRSGPGGAAFRAGLAAAAARAAGARWGGGGQWPVFTGREGEKVPLWCAPACGVGSGVCGRRQQGCGLQCPGVGQQSPCLRSYGEECPFWNGLVVKTWQTTISNNIRWLAGCGSLLPLLLLLPPTSQT
jgi:hypothetical protein